MKKALALILAVVLFVSAFSSCGKSEYLPVDITDRLQNLGINCREKWDNSSAAAVVSRNPYDMVNFNGKIFISGGNYGDNTGGVPMNYCENGSETLISTAVLPTEEVDELYVFDGKLYATEVDPKEWGNSSVWYYSDEAGKWESAYNVLKGCIHCFDMEKFGESLFFCGSDTVDNADIQSIGVIYRIDKPIEEVTREDVLIIPYYDRNGRKLTHENMYSVQKVSETVSLSAAGVPRFYDMFVFGGELYALLEGGASEFNGLYKYDAENECFRFDTATDMNSVFKRSDFGYNDDGIILHSLEYDGVVYFVMNSSAHSLYSSSDLKNYEKITIPGFEDAEINDIIMINGVPHLLASQRVEGEYVNFVFSTSDFRSFFLKYYFSSELPARSFEYSEGSYYFGLGFSYTHIYGQITLPDHSELCGTVLRYDPKRISE